MWGVGWVVERSKAVGVVFKMMPTLLVLEWLGLVGGVRAWLC